MTSSLQPYLATRRSSLEQILSTELRSDGNRIYPFTRLTDDLFLDRMDIDLLIASVESRLNFYLTEEQASQIETVGDLHTFFLS